MDIVLPFVTCAEEVWMREVLKQKIKVMPIYNDSSKMMSVMFNLFYDYGTLKYALRGIDKFMPEVDNLFLVVSNIEQVPDYVDQSKVKVVLHSEFMPENLLPNYDSGTIEMFINKIPGLGEEFVYFNDDMIPIHQISYDELFKNGLPCIHFIENDRRLDAPSNKMCRLSFFEAMNSVMNETGENLEFKGRELVPLHMPTPMKKSVMDQYSNQDRFPALVDFYCHRDRRERCLNQYYWSDILYFSKQYVPSDMQFKLVPLYDLRDFKVKELGEEIKYVCINDMGRDMPLTEVENIVKEQMDMILPEKCSYEK